MTRDELRQLIEIASLIADDDVIVIGSQSILGTFRESELPARATMSVEADLAFLDDVDNVKSDRVDMDIGEGSSFDALRGYYGQGVDLSVATLPDGWRERLVDLPSPSGMGRCLEPHDLALSKLVAGREKDFEFVFALLESRLLDLGILIARINDLPITGLQRKRILNWLDWAKRTR